MTPIGPLQVRAMLFMWTAGKPCSVYDVQGALNAQPGARTLAYTTILTIMRNLARRGYVSVDDRARSHLFTPTISYTEYVAAVAAEFVGTLFSGNIDKAMVVVHQADIAAISRLEAKLRPVAPVAAAAAG